MRQLYRVPHGIIRVFNTILYENEFQNPQIYPRNYLGCLTLYRCNEAEYAILKIVGTWNRLSHCVITWKFETRERHFASVNSCWRILMENRSHKNCLISKKYCVHPKYKSITTNFSMSICQILHCTSKLECKTCLLEAFSLQQHGMSIQ
jgi:hypothetical protein